MEDVHAAIIQTPAVLAVAHPETDAPIGGKTAVRRRLSLQIRLPGVDKLKCDDAHTARVSLRLAERPLLSLHLV